MFHISKFPSLGESTLAQQSNLKRPHPCRFTFDHRIKEKRKISHPLRFPLRISHTFEIRKKSTRRRYIAACPTRIYSSSGRKKLLSVFARTFRSATESGKSIRWAARLSRCSQEKGRIPFGRVKREIWNSCGGTPSRDFPPLSARPSNRGETSLFPHSLPPSLVPLSPNISPNSLKTLLSDRVASTPVVF